MTTTALAAAGRLQVQGDEHELRDLLVLPSSPAPMTPVVDKVESGGPLGAGGPPPPPPPPSDMAADDTSSCGGRWRRRRRRGSNKRGRDGTTTTRRPMASIVEQNEEPRAAQLQPPHHHSCKRRRRRRRKQQMGMGTSSSLVTSAPNLDGYRWRKYGQKQIKGAMYPRSYYRCKRSAEQGCAATRTVQRNNDDGGGATPRYTVVCFGEHTCAANDSLEAPLVILETTADVPDAATTRTNKRLLLDEDDGGTSSSTRPVAPTPPAGPCRPTTAAANGTVSPAISHFDDCPGLMLAAQYDNCWVPDLTGPILSPVHIDIAAAADGWTVDQCLLQLLNEPASLFSSVDDFSF